MDGFYLDFSNGRASRYVIRAISAEAVNRHVMLTSYREVRAALKTDREREEFAECEAPPLKASRFRKFVDIYLRDLPEEERFALTHEVAAVVRDEKLKSTRLTPQALDLAVKLLVERRTTPLDTAVLTIARAAGLLMFGGGSSEPLWVWLKLERRLRHMFEGRSVLQSPRFKDLRWPDPGTWFQCTVNVELRPNKDGRPIFTLRPKSLEEALVVHAARSIDAGATFQTCEGCGSPFLTGGNAAGAQRRKRADARFCSDQCRWDFNNKRKRANKGDKS